MSRIEKAEVLLIEARRLLRNSNKRSKGLVGGYWTRPRRCGKCQSPIGRWVRNGKVSDKIDKERVIQGKLWERRWKLMQYIKACKLVDKGIPS